MGMPLTSGAILRNRYRIQRRIGGGGMGSVYLAEDLVFRRLIAVKEMIEMFADEAAREKSIADFQREAELLARLDHPAIPTIFDYFFDDSRGRYYLVMKYIDGGDLATQLRLLGGKIDELVVTQWGVEICEVLDYIHSQTPPIIYRDLKPANLMLDNHNRIMLVDFGIARVVAPTQKGVTAIGTAGYAPPELFAGHVEPASDIYSLGATMFHLLTGHDPQDHPLVIFDFAKNPRPRQIDPNITPEMEAMIIKAVEYKCEDRYAAVSILGKELKHHLRTISQRDQIEDSSGAIEPPGAAGVWHCIHCGHEMLIDAIFCVACGKRQTLEAPAKLIILSDEEQVAEIILSGEGAWMIGRTDQHRSIRPFIDLSKYDPEHRISRRHAKIFADGDWFYIEDFGAQNGTIINEQIRLKPDTPHLLESGDEIRFGATRVRFLHQRRASSSQELTGRLLVDSSRLESGLKRIGTGNSGVQWLLADSERQKIDEASPPSEKLEIPPAQALPIAPVSSPPPSEEIDEEEDEVPEAAVATITCPACQHQQPMPAKFCNECGSQLTPKPATPPALLICPQGHIYNSATETCPYCERLEHTVAVVEAKAPVQQPVGDDIEPATRAESPLAPDEPLRTTGSLPRLVEENSDPQARIIPAEDDNAVSLNASTHEREE
jgi:serine/threonine-protein kinase